MVPCKLYITHVRMTNIYVVHDGTSWYGLVFRRSMSSCAFSPVTIFSPPFSTDKTNFAFHVWCLCRSSSNETVEVGAQLYEIDTDAQATVVIADATTTVAVPVDTNSQANNQAIESVHIGDNTDNASSSHHTSNRSPSIRFLGKDGWTQRLSGGGTEPEHAAPPVVKPAVIVPSKPNAVTVLDGSMLTSRYGRPNFSEEEMEALILGGANVAPTVVVPSSGAVFSISNKN